jgi:hypothetical protein
MSGPGVAPDPVVATCNGSPSRARDWAFLAAFAVGACARERPNEAPPVTNPPRSGAEWVQQREQLPRTQQASAVRAAPYALDSLNRKITTGWKCPAVDAREFAGSRVRFVPAAKVIAPFREHLLELEQVASEVGLRVYGRAPARIRIAASYDCRPVTGNGGRLSEHALGNAIDITAFEFPASFSVGPDRSLTNLTLAGPLEVRVDRHWHAEGDPVVERHARFLTELTDELIARGVFRTLLGPAHPDHKDHFHFDMAPHPYVKL